MNGSNQQLQKYLQKNPLVVNMMLTRLQRLQATQKTSKYLLSQQQTQYSFKTYSIQPPNGIRSAPRQVNAFLSPQTTQSQIRQFSTNDNENGANSEAQDTTSASKEETGPSAEQSGGAPSQAEMAEAIQKVVEKGSKRPPRKKKDKKQMPPKQKGSFLKKGGGEFTKEELNHATHQSQNQNMVQTTHTDYVNRKALNQLRMSNPEEYAKVQSLRWQMREDELEEILAKEHRSRLAETHEFSDLETEMENQQAMDKIDVLRQVVTDPDYQSKQELFNKSSPQAQSVQEQKAQALNKLAAFKKSAEVLKNIKSRLGKDKQMKTYLVNELNKSGSEIGEFLAHGVTGELGSTQKEIKANTQAILQQKQAQQQILKQHRESIPEDSITFGVMDQFGPNTFQPASEHDSFPKHDKTKIDSFIEYQKYTLKMRKEIEAKDRERKKERYDELFERYNIPRNLRKYIFLSDLAKVANKDTVQYQANLEQYQKLASLIPELAVEASQPNYQKNLQREVRREIADLTRRFDAINYARQPYIEQQLEEMKPKFMEENQHLGEKDLEKAWEVEVQKYNQELPEDDLHSQIQNLQNWADTLGAARNPIQDPEVADKTQIEIMTDKLYQKLNENAEDGSLSIDRVSRDGPRDRIGDFQDRLKSGVLYDFEKASPNAVANTLEARAYDEAQSQEKGSTWADHIWKEDQSVKYHLENNYDYAKKVESAIEQSRKRIAKDMLAMQNKLAEIQTKKDALQDLVAKKHVQEIESQVLPGQKVHDFIEFEAQSSSENSQALLEQELQLLLENKAEFDPKSSDPKAYEAELKVHSCHALLSQALGKPVTDLSHFGFVLQQMRANHIQQTVQLDARLFEYSMLAGKPEVANELIQKLRRDGTEQYSPIDPRFLLKYFKDCLKRDNIDGTAHLVNYSERYDVNLGNFPINNFRAALDHYLNKQFDFNKVMTFLKFYQKHFRDRASTEFAQIEPMQENISDEQISALSTKIFSQSDGLVALPDLFASLVDQVGTRQVIDPITKEDSIWSLIESQTNDKDFIRVTQLTSQSKIGGRPIARYLANQFSRGNSFDRTIRTALRVQGTPLEKDFFPEIIQQLNAYALKNMNQLPSSFTEKKLSDLYLRLKLSEAEISPAMGELLLFALNKKQMHEQIVDFCTNQSNKASEINKYYLAESLFQSVSLGDKTYAEALQSSQVFGDAADGLSACELTQKTKAMFLDRSDQTAVNFFRDELAKREETVKQRKDLLVALYDNIMGNQKDKVLSFDEFKARHQKSKLFTQRLIAQTYAVSNLQQIVENNDYEGIDDSFNLYMVLSQIRDMFGDSYVLVEDADSAQVIKLKSAAQFSPEQSQQLDLLLDRRMQLQRRISAEDYQRVKEILEITDGAELDTMQGLELKGLNRVLNMFQDMSFDEVRQYTMNQKESSGTHGGSNHHSSSRQRNTKPLSTQDKIQSMRTDLRKATNLRSLMASVTQFTKNDTEPNDNTDWFQEFANAKKSKYDQALAKYIQKKAGIFAKNQLTEKNNEETDMTNAEETARLLTLINQNPKVQSHLAGMSVPEQEAYLHEMAKEAREFFEDPEISDQDIQQIEKEHLDTIQDYMEGLLDAFDPALEFKLELEHDLHAKKVILYKESINQNRKDQLSNLDINDPKQREQLIDYAKQINLLRFDVVELEHQHAEICQQIEETQQENEQQNQGQEDDMLNDELQQHLYNQGMNDQLGTSVSMDKASAQDLEILQSGIQQTGGSSDPKAILEHFEMRQKQQIVTGANHDMQIDYSLNILPEKYVELETEACQAAVDEHLGSNGASVSEDGAAVKDSTDKQKNGADEINAIFGTAAANKDKPATYTAASLNSQWANKLTSAIDQEKKRSYSLYYYGVPQHEFDEDGMYSHPRQLINDLDDASLSDQSREMKVMKRLGIDPAKTARRQQKDPIFEQYRTTDKKELKRRALIREEIASQAEQEALNKHFSQVIENPIEYFERKNIKDALIDTQIYRTDRMDNSAMGHRFLPWVKEKKLNDYLDRMLYDPIPYTENGDPINYLRKAHDDTIMDLKVELTKAISDKKADALPIAIKIFNRIQDKAVKTTRLNIQKLDDKDKSSDQIESINEQLSQVDILLNDPSSPLISKIRSSSKYATQKLPETIDQYRAQIRDGDILANAVDLNQIINDYRQINKTEDHINSVSKVLETITEELDEKQKSLTKQRNLQLAYENKVNKAKSDQAKKNEEYLSKLYTEYLAAKTDNKSDEQPGFSRRGSDSYDDDISDETKVSLMQDALRIQLGQEAIDTSAFPAFYALDLIQFGLKREIPAAIRLGELVLAEKCQDHHQSAAAKQLMPRELAQAVKDYMMSNQDQYQEAAKYTGPINNTAIYHQAMQANSSVEKPIFYNVDDPYWYAFQQKNYRREDNWRMPSVLAWDHKPRGLIGEVLDIDRLEKSYSEYFGSDDFHQSSSQMKL